MLDPKIKTLPQLKKVAKSLKRRNKKIVFTNGCFDILHFGHIEYLKLAKKKGDVLVVGLNSDSSVRKIKGKERPFTKQKQRAHILSALSFVDFVIIFKDTTPLHLIRELKPDILIKGGDWARQDIVGSDIVKKYKGRVITVPYVRGFSTSGLIKKIIREQDCK
jgi:rfaE bifunctional protein nucleotidyltransferase chain/domain